MTNKNTPENKNEVQTEKDVRIGQDEALSRVKEKVRSGLLSAPTVVRPLTRHLAKAEGKNIRARALLLCASGNDGKVDEKAVETAAAVELLHLATLVHDDIIDDATKRRGIAALHTAFGTKAAVLCGDYLMSYAIKLAAQVGSAVSGDQNNDSSSDSNMDFGQIVADNLSNICLGELLQDENNGNFSLTEQEYFDIISGKTAALFRVSFILGFLLSKEPKEHAESYLQIGNSVGLMFQLADDCADFESSEKKSKKPVLSDYKQGVITLPLIYAMEQNPNLKRMAKSGTEPERLKIEIEKSGGLDYTKEKIRAFLKEAKTLISSLEVDQTKKEALVALAQAAAGDAAGRTI